MSVTQEIVSLSNLDKARTIVAEANLAQATEIIAEAEALRIYAQQANKGLELQNQCAEIKIRAERRAGELLAEVERSQGVRTDLTSSHDGTKSYAQTLKDNDLAHTVAHRWQLEAKLPEPDFVAWVTETQAKAEVTSGGLRAHIQRQLASNNVVNIKTWPKGKYRVIYADPPWQYSNRQPDYFTTQDDHYTTLPLEEIAALPINDLALENAVLFLWATSPGLEDALHVINAWGFKYKASFVWDKVKHNMGHYNSVRHEFLLVAVKGSCQPDVPRLFDSVVTIERKGHSDKPEKFRRIIETLYPYGPRIELFSRRHAEGWEAFGHDIS